MLNLMLHCGADSVSRQQVEAVRTPHNTKTWYPIPHSNLLDRVESSLDGVGLHVVNQSHGMTKAGNRYFGLMEVTNGDNPEDYSLVIGIRNSHDKSFPAGLVVGSGVFVCDNLAFSGEIKLGRKHTRFINRDLGGLVNRAMGKLGDLRHSQDRRIEAYKTTQLTDNRAHDLMIRSLDARIIPPSALPAVIKEWREPSYGEFTEDGNTVWRLFNGYTEVLKQRGNLQMLPERTAALHALADGASNVAA